MDIARTWCCWERHSLPWAIRSPRPGLRRELLSLSFAGSDNWPMLPPHQQPPDSSNSPIMSTSTDAISIIPARAKQPSRAAVTAAYFAAFVALGLTTGSLGPTLPALATQTRVGLSAVSYLFTARSLGYVLGALRGGKLFDRRAGNSVMAGTLIVMAAAMALVPLSAALWTLLVVMLLLGA